MRVPSNEAPQVQLHLPLRKGTDLLTVQSDPGPVTVDNIMHNGDLRAISVRMSLPTLKVDKPKKSKKKRGG
jgi:hypothetical protein